MTLSIHRRGWIRRGLELQLNDYVDDRGGEGRRLVLAMIMLRKMMMLDEEMITIMLIFARTDSRRSNVPFHHMTIVFKELDSLI